MMLSVLVSSQLVYVKLLPFLILQVSKAAWATVLALIWLHSSKVEAKKEWELIAVKAVSWLKTQKGMTQKKQRLLGCFGKSSALSNFMSFCAPPPTVASMSDCVAAGNALLCCNVQTDTLGL